jgi:hypothetical protein
MNNGWQMDDSDNVILFRLPATLLLKLQLDTARPIPSKTDITTLPYDIVLIISDNLDLTDRVCLGLTCKPLALAITCAPRLPGRYEIRGDYCVNGVYSPNPFPLCISMTPEWYTLLPRLAKGWVPKEKYKHCWKCNKIYPRDRSFYEKTLSKQKAPGWLWKLNLTEQEWRRMSLPERHEHMIARWLTDDDLVHASLRPPSRVYNVYYPDLGVWASRKTDERGPECPICLERELMYSWRTPKGLFPVSTSTKVTLVGLIKAPIDLGIAAGSTMIGALRFRS